MSAQDWLSLVITGGVQVLLCALGALLVVLVAEGMGE